MSKKRRQKIDKDEAEKLLNGFGFSIQHLTWYQFRIKAEESNDIYDWYHTTGATVRVRGGYNARVGTFRDVEELAEFIKKDSK